MSGGTAEYNTGKVGIVETGENALMGRGRTQGGGNVLQGGDPIEITIWFGDVGNFGRNGEEGRRGTHGLPQKYHGEAIVVDSRRDMGDTRGGSST